MKDITAAFQKLRFDFVHCKNNPNVMLTLNKSPFVLKFWGANLSFIFQTLEK